MATINNELDFDTAFLVAGEFGVTTNKRKLLMKKMFYLMSQKIKQRT